MQGLGKIPHSTCPLLIILIILKKNTLLKKRHSQRSNRLIGYWLSTRWAVPSGQKTFSPRVTFAKRRLHSVSCLSHPSQSRDNILSFHLNMTFVISCLYAFLNK